MHFRACWGIGAWMALCAVLQAGDMPGRPSRAVSSHYGAPNAPPARTRCDLSLPIRVEMIPLNQPEVGRRALFQVTVDSQLDPDLVRSSRVEYSVRRRGTGSRETTEERDVLRRSRQDRFEVGVTIQDESRHEVRARYVVELIDGRTMAQTAVRWVDLGAEDPPEGMIGRILNADGAGIRVYQGVGVKR